MNNPHSRYWEACFIEELLHSREIHYLITLLQTCLTSDVVAAAVVGSRTGRERTPTPVRGLQHNLGLGGACVVAMYRGA
ncbi:MAG: hypothetical protein U5K56_03690 [Halioglobus sp.]|nr:hypothetical protein [Halioglobus sp.]